MIRQRTCKIRMLSAFVPLIAALVVLTAFAGSAIAQDPVPFIDQPLVPDATAPGGAGFTLTVNGGGFVAGSVVNWNGSPRATTFVSNHKLTAAIPAADIATASTASVTVVNPSPGGGASNNLYFSIAAAETSVSFLPAVAYDSGGSGSTSIAVADLNGDGKPDVVVANCIAHGTVGCGAPGTLGVLIGNGDGTFQPVVTYDTGGVGASSIAVGDVNGDGKPDLIVANECTVVGCPVFGLGTVDVLLGNGDGTFQQATSYSSGGESPESVAVADVNGDGKLDIVVANLENSSRTGIIGVLLGNGDGTFEPAISYGGASLQGALGVAVADVNGDGKPDLVVAYQCELNCSSGAAVGVLLGNGDGTFQPAAIYPSGGFFSFSIAVADVNGDGKPDLVVTNFCKSGSSCGGLGSGNGSVGVLLGNGDGTFQDATAYDSGGLAAFSVAIADVNGDGKPDLIAANDNSGTVGILLGNGDGTFQMAATFTSGYPGPDSVAVADVNGDGKPDLVGVCRDPGMVDVLLNNGGSSENPTTTTLASSLSSSVYGQAVTFTAQVTASSGTPTGTVLLFDGSTAVATRTVTGGRALIVDSSLPVGANSITAEYTGGGGFASSSSTPLIHTVSAATTSTGLTSSLNPASTGRSVTFSATVTSQFGGVVTGSVTFYSGSQTLGAATLSSNRASLTTSFATSGIYSISAKYNGDGNNKGSTSSNLSQVIIAATATKLTSSLNPSLAGQAVTFAATVSSTAGTPPNGETVTFHNGSAVLGTASLSGGIASLTTSSLPVGIFTITATYAGDAKFAASTSPGLRQVVNSASKSATSTALVSSLNPSIYGQKISWMATVTTSGSISPTGKVNFTWNGHSIGTATLNAGGVATLSKSDLNVYTYPLTAVYAGDANNIGSTSTILNQVVKQTTSTAKISSSANPSTLGQAVTFTAKITSPTVTATGPVTFTAGTTVLGTSQLSGGKATLTTSTFAVGATTVKATYYGDSNIAGSSASLTQTVQQ